MPPTLAVQLDELGAAGADNDVGVRLALELSRAASACEALADLRSGVLERLVHELDLKSASLLLPSRPRPLLAGSSAAVEQDLVSEVQQQGVAILCSRGADESDDRRSIAVVPVMHEAQAAWASLWAEAAPSRLEQRELAMLTLIAQLLGPSFWRLSRKELLEQRSSVGVGESNAWQRVVSAISRIADTDSTVLLAGESGTGKEIVARALHERSSRDGGPFVAVNCATLSESLLESELFGHEKGAFTGADARKLGRFELASGGTLFLDEVGEIPLGLQAKLLRALESRELERVGGTEPVPFDARLIAATNRDLAREVENGSFRQDLYYRLCVVDVTLPPLRDRGQDVLLLAESFLDQLAAEMGRGAMSLSPAVKSLLTSYRWPGNVRELRNAVERAVVLAEDSSVEPEDLPESVRESARPGDSDQSPFHAALAARKRELIRTALDNASGNVSAAARALGLSPNYLHRLMTNLGLRD